MHTGVIALLVGLALGPAASSAGAATVERPADTSPDPDPIVVTAAPGEVNDVTLAAEVVAGPPDRRSLVTVRDAGAPLTAGPGCTSPAPGVVQCETETPGGRVNVHAGDGDDRVTIGEGFDSGVVAVEASGEDGQDELVGGPQEDRLRGGPGNDSLAGGEESDYLDGGAGDDALHGGSDVDDLIGGATPGEDPGNDRLFGDAGGDRLDDGDGTAGAPAPGPDVLDGGGGSDWVASYAARVNPVYVDLEEPGMDGEAGEGDSLTGVENLRGGLAADTLLGNHRANRIFGQEGDDTVHGRGGPDDLDAIGAASVSGGEGDDTFRTVRDFRGTITCGDGVDVLRYGFYSKSYPGGRDSRGPLLAPACERMRSRSYIWSAVPARNRRAGTLTFRFRSVRCCGARLALEGYGSRRASRRVVFSARPRRGAVLRAVFTSRRHPPVPWRFRAPR